jgi:hypothetical protein
MDEESTSQGGFRLKNLSIPLDKLARFGLSSRLSLANGK